MAEKVLEIESESQQLQKVTEQDDEVKANAEGIQNEENPPQAIQASDENKANVKPEDSVSQVPTKVKRVGDTLSKLTSVTGKSTVYISALHKELEEEKRARQRLEQELEELRKISSEITSHLGLKTGTNAFNRK